MNTSYRRCGYCGKPDHPTQLCQSTWGGQSKTNAMRCTYCGKRTHTTKFCPNTAAGPGNRRSNPNGDFID
jgi:primosomal protein N'